MGRVALGAAGALLVGLAVWAAWPSSPPVAASSSPGSSSGLVGPTPIVPTAEGQGGRARLEKPAVGDLDVQLAGCIGAQRAVAAMRAQRGGPAPAGAPSDAAIVSKGCAPLYKEAACREAMMRFDDPPPERRSAAVLQACARAYCDKLTAPKPKVCSHVDAVPDNEEQYSEWSDLRLAILTHDLGSSAAQIVLAGPPRSR